MKPRFSGYLLFEYHQLRKGVDGDEFDNGGVKSRVSVSLIELYGIEYNERI